MQRFKDLASMALTGLLRAVMLARETHPRPRMGQYPCPRSPRLRRRPAPSGRCRDAIRHAVFREDPKPYRNGAGYALSLGRRGAFTV